MTMTDDIHDFFKPTVGAAIGVIREHLTDVLRALDVNEWKAVRAGECWDGMSAVAVSVPAGLELRELMVIANGRPCDFSRGTVLAVLAPSDAATLELRTDSDTVTIPIAGL